MPDAVTTSRLVDILMRESERPTSRPGPEIVRLQSGEPDAATPQTIKDALTRALADGLTHYASPSGDEELLRAISREVSAIASREVSLGEITVTAGGTGGITCAILATVNAGDRVVIPEPTYSLYADVVRAVGGIPVFIPCTSAMELDVPRIVEASRDSRMVIICNPCNPTGVVYSRDALLQLADGLIGSDCLILADEAYSRIVYDHDFFSMLQIPSLADRLIYCQTFSKTYCMTGWRIGYVVAAPQIIRGISRIHQMFTHSVNAAVQKAAVVALQTPDLWVEERLLDYRERRDLVVSTLTGVPGIRLIQPQGAFYAFVGFSADASSRQITQRLLERGLAVRSGTEFGPSGEGFVRLSFSVDRTSLVRGLQILTDTLAG